MSANKTKTKEGKGLKPTVGAAVVGACDALSKGEKKQQARKGVGWGGGVWGRLTERIKDIREEGLADFHMQSLRSLPQFDQGRLERKVKREGKGEDVVIVKTGSIKFNWPGDFGQRKDHGAREGQSR